MTRGIEEFTDAPTGDRWEIMRRAEGLRAEETRRLVSALSRRVRAAFAGAAGRHSTVEPVFIPRGPSSAIF